MSTGGGGGGRHRRLGISRSGVEKVVDSMLGGGGAMPLVGHGCA